MASLLKVRRTTGFLGDFGDKLFLGELRESSGDSSAICTFGIEIGLSECLEFAEILLLSLE